MPVRITFGKSMYGGWYANFFINGEYKGIHADSKLELETKLKANERYDN